MAWLSLPFPQSTGNRRGQTLNEFPFPPDRRGGVPGGQHSAMADINHERLGEVLGRGRGGVFTDMMFRVVFPLKIPVVRCAKRLGKAARPEQAAMRVRDGMRKLVPQHIAQRGIAALPEMREPRKRDAGNVDVPRGAIPLPAVGGAKENQVSIHGLDTPVVKTVRREIAGHGVVRLIEPALGYEVHGVGITQSVFVGDSLRPVPRGTALLTPTRRADFHAGALAFYQRPRDANG